MEYKRNDQNENGLRRRRRRHWNNANDNPNHDTIWNDSNIHNGETKETFVLTFNSILWIPILLHMISIVTILNGIYLRFSLHNGSDCEMTYSHRHFVPIHISNSKSPYKLYKVTVPIIPYSVAKTETIEMTKMRMNYDDDDEEDIGTMQMTTLIMIPSGTIPIFITVRRKRHSF